MKNIKYSIMTLLFLIAATQCTHELSEDQIIKKAKSIQEKALTLDTHIDTPMRFGNPDFNMAERHDAHKGEGKVDFVRMKEGGMDGAFFADFIGQGPLTDEGREAAYQKAKKILKSIHETAEKNSDIAGFATTPEDAYRLKREGKRIMFCGMENGYPIGLDLAKLKEFYDGGVRYITLCHTSNNDICDSSTDKNGPLHNGLSDFGKKVVAEMNRLGIMVDVSHISDKSFYDVMKITKAPVIASHSSVRALCDSPRDMTDDMIKTLAKNGGVIQICILSEYLKKTPPNPQRDSALATVREKYNNFKDLSDEEMKQARAAWSEIRRKYPNKMATVKDAVDHIDHVVQLVGIDHVGIGTDFDGGGGIEGCYDVSEMGNITIELVRRGYTEKEIKKIWGGNLLRVLKEVERVAKEQQST